MITVRTPNPNFRGERAGIRFENGTARVAELTGKQLQALRGLGYEIDGAVPAAETGETEKPLADMTIAELREVAAQQSIDLGKLSKRDDILEAVEAGIAAASLPEREPADDGESDDDLAEEAGESTDEGDES